MTANCCSPPCCHWWTDLSRDLPEGERYRRLLQAMRTLLPCDAAACCDWTVNGWCPWPSTA
jgi:hypothetical protein